MSPAPDLSDYVEVSDRMAAFFAAHPSGSLQCREWDVRTVADKTFVVYTALAYRAPDDAAPGVGTAWEPFPGRTPYTRDSELMNAETSAWGRALAAVGFGGKRVASRNEVRNRQADTTTEAGEVAAVAAATTTAGTGGVVPAPKQVEYLKRLLTGQAGYVRPTRKQLTAMLTKLGLSGPEPGWVQALTADQCDQLIWTLTRQPAKSVEHPTDIPADPDLFQHEAAA